MAMGIRKPSSAAGPVRFRRLPRGGRPGNFRRRIRTAFGVGSIIAANALSPIREGYAERNVPASPERARPAAGHVEKTGAKKTFYKVPINAVRSFFGGHPLDRSVKTVRRIIYVPGAYNINNLIKRGFQREVVNALAEKKYDVKEIKWATRTLLMNHLSRSAQEKAAADIADSAMRSWKAGRGVYILGHSSAANSVIRALKILATEHPEIRINKVVLAGASVSSNEDLSIISRICSKENFINIYNPLDVVANAVGTGIFGQAGGERTIHTSAGLTGFKDTKFVTNVRLPVSLLQDQHDAGLKFAQKFF